MPRLASAVFLTIQHHHLPVFSPTRSNQLALTLYPFSLSNTQGVPQTDAKTVSFVFGLPKPIIYYASPSLTLNRSVNTSYCGKVLATKSTTMACRFLDFFFGLSSLIHSSTQSRWAHVSPNFPSFLSVFLSGSTHCGSRCGHTAPQAHLFLTYSFLDICWWWTFHCSCSISFP